MTYTLQRWTGDPNDPQFSTTQFNTIAELIADVRANDNLTENEFFGFLLTGAFATTDRGLSFSENA